MKARRGYVYYSDERRTWCARLTYTDKTGKRHEGSEKSSELAGLSPAEVNLLVMLMNRLNEPAALAALRQLAIEEGLNFDNLLQIARELSPFGQPTPLGSTASKTFDE